MIVRTRFCLALACCLATLAVFGQELGRVEGRVVNAGQGIGGVTIKVHQTDAIVVSDQDGRFVLEGLSTGNYTLLLEFGDNELVRIVAVTEGQTTELELEVDWTAGGYEKVEVSAGIERVGKIVDAPAAVTSVTEEEIGREASHGQLPKVLEYSPGAEVTQSGLYDFNFNTRGFNSSLNRRVSTYIDGRDIGVPLLGAQEWSALSIPLDDLGSLEFVRGPSAALYGANASSGVINMTTKAPRDFPGGSLRTTVGELDTVAMDVRWADELGKGWWYKVIAGFRDSGDFAVSRDPCPGEGPGCPGIPAQEQLVPEYSEYCRRVGEIDCLPQERELIRENDDEFRFASLRADKYFSDESVMTIEAGSTNVGGPVFQTGIGRVQALDADRPWARIAYSRPHFNVLAHWSNREGHQVNMAKGLRADFDLYTDTLRYGAEFQTDWAFVDDTVLFAIGGAFTQEDIDSADPATGQQTVVYEPLKEHREALFTQFEWTASRHFKTVLAWRVDWSTLHSTQFSPKAALVYSINPKHSVRLTYNEAFQVANYSEFFLHTRLTTFPLLGFAQVICAAAGQGFSGDCLGITDNSPVIAVGNENLSLEQTKAWEVGYSGILGRKTFLTLDYYNSQNEDFITDLVPQINTSLVNLSSKPPRVNPDYRMWVGPEEAETSFLFEGTPDQVTWAQALRNGVARQVGDLPLGMMLARDLDGSTTIVGRTYANVGTVETQGVDMGLTTFLTDAWNLQFTYSWFDFEIIEGGPAIEQTSVGFQGAGDLDDLLLPNTPEHKASISATVNKRKWDVTLGARWVEDFRWSAGLFQGNVQCGETDLLEDRTFQDRPFCIPSSERDPDDPRPLAYQDPEPYTTVDLAANWYVHERVSLGLNVANLLDNVHRQTFGGDLLRRRALFSVSFYW